MKHELTAFGIILLLIGLVASFYKETHYVSHVGYQTVTPYLIIGLILAVAGIVVTALGFILKKEREI